MQTMPDDAETRRGRKGNQLNLQWQPTQSLSRKLPIPEASPEA